MRGPMADIFEVLRECIQSMKMWHTHHLHEERWPARDNNLCGRGLAFTVLNITILRLRMGIVDVLLENTSWNMGLQLQFVLAQTVAMD